MHCVSISFIYSTTVYWYSFHIGKIANCSTTNTLTCIFCLACVCVFLTDVYLAVVLLVHSVYIYTMHGVHSTNHIAQQEALQHDSRHLYFLLAMCEGFVCPTSMPVLDIFHLFHFTTWLCM
jgi:hypothetical protein